MKRNKAAAILAGLCVLILPLVRPVGAEGKTDTLARGKYLVTIMDCSGCQMPHGPDGAPMTAQGLSGGNVGFEIPGAGMVWPPNLTPDETGLGAFPAAEIADTIRTGVRPDGRMLAPVMPAGSYAVLSDEDAAAIAAYLQSLPPVKTTAAPPVADASAAPLPFFRVTMPGIR